ncbi:ABC transporter ATP-binding protein [Methylobacterium gregans]|uniref:Glutathione import ATP-binding protein GsiA n=1 Tax=Methylobacterium gregans TaxID=374424 RepID=A0AA37MAA4_9HYPH|nr:peptide/nickel transport system ATP-binding protein [Methylobacterium gregans]GJD78540.1 Glutathione import ATP-binding protein GsiA [Methylobacterium gregans]GLS52913.1 ABC transporter ATP-binding protein [Methylobacterium gregans]
MDPAPNPPGVAVSVRDLRLALPLGGDRPNAVDGVSFDLMAGEILCIVGESGSGKSMCAHALMGLLPKAVTVASGSIRLGDTDLLAQDAAGWRDTRGRRIAMVFQEPMTALNPLMRIGDQMAEMFEAHGLLTPPERRARAVALAREVGLPDPEGIVRSYPHQLSGGQRQRAMIAMALALEPAILVADEPTTALDVTTQAQILKLIRDLQRRRNMAVLFITHDFGVVTDIADRVLVLRQGRVVEEGPAAALLGAPREAYTQALLAAVPAMNPPARTPTEGPKTIEVAGLSKTYVTGGGWWRKPRTVAAARDVSFALRRGETLGLVGESGSGKSSVARLVMRLIEPDLGSVRLGDTELTRLNGEALRRARSRIQMVFQDPFASLNPRRTVGQIITDGPVAHGVSLSDARGRAVRLLGLVGLDMRAFERFPHEFSGGQRQRIGIARALALEPEVLVADEAVSALDVSVQAQVLALLEDLKVRFGLSMLFITHDLRVAAQICDRIAVMRRGEIVELKTAADLFANPEHPYTRDLLAAVPGRAREAA